jgi:hypothetical protein
MKTIDNSTYLGNRKLKPVDVKIPWSQDNIQEYLKCSREPVYFIKNYVKIVNVDRGLIPFQLWPFQEEMVQTMIDNRFFIAKMPRQVGKTQTVAAVLLWYVLFHENFSIAILANKDRQAREILGRIQNAYEHLPKWLQQGIVTWNKGDIELENGSKILASATSSSAIRGTSQNLVYLDEFAFVAGNLQEEFFNSVYPTISSGKTTKVLITSTPNGMNMFYKIWTDSEEGRNTYVRQSVHWSMIPGRDDQWKKETISNTSERQFEQEFECEFLGSSNTLIDARKLRQLVWKPPLHSYDHMDVYEEPIQNHKYVITVDTSRGVGIDYSVFVVFDVTTIPYKLVAKYRDNEISPLLYPNIIWRTGKYYNEAMVLVEVNDNGQQIADILYYDLEYEGVLLTQTKGRAGIKVGGNYKIKPTRGVKTTKQVKRIGCANLKTLIEQDRLLFSDYDLVYELFRFVENKASYEAEEGEHDDIVMCCVLFAWLAHQQYFRNKTETDVRSDLWEENREMIEDSIAPFGFFDVNTVYKGEEVVSQNVFDNLDIHPTWYDADDYGPQGDNVLPPSW